MTSSYREGIEKGKQMTGKGEPAQGQLGTTSGWQFAEGARFAQKVAFGLGVALLAGTAVVPVPVGPSAASPDGYTVTSVTLSSPLNAIHDSITTCCALLISSTYDQKNYQSRRRHIVNRAVMSFYARSCVSHGRQR
jgi:hypothetical protein